ncbi:MAG: FAD-dependent oxidoreductase, partial [Spirochaetales bacterium]|nr:FAD-dependent oxidoreductase [Spirochaetales bacterium]
ENLTTVRIKSKKDGSITEIPATGAFIFIGYVPKTKPFNDCIELNKNGEILVDDDMATTVPGVFAAGDARKKRYRQITTAVSDGTIAALSAMDYLATQAKA